MKKKRSVRGNKKRLMLGLDERLELERFLAWVEALSPRGKVRLLTEILTFERMQEVVPPWVAVDDPLPIARPEKGVVPEEVVSAILAEYMDKKERAL